VKVEVRTRSVFMNKLSIVLIVLASMGGLVVGLFSLARSGPRFGRPGAVRVAPVDGEPQTHSGITVGATGGLTGVDPSDLILARLALESAVCLRDKARRNPGDLRPLEQAVCHLHACLSHESTTSDPGSLFRDARRTLAEIEQLLDTKQYIVPPASDKLTTTAPGTAVKGPPSPEANPAPKAVRTQTVGPDGLPIQRVSERLYPPM
jgi:hypothetical protein